jgi:2-polyprenyl-3-methyl-5-hydroxy-6-metoxy-1,4-benzoquinol methylase
MKVLVAIANYGAKNDQYLRRLLEEYRSMSHDVHVVVLSNMPKNLAAGVELVVETPRGDPWSFPFAHKKILAERRNHYDLFIYSEDDTLITQRNVDAFLRVTDVLPEDEVAGFMRSERGPEGTTYLSTVHGPYHWEPTSVVCRGQYLFAHFTNDHSASYMITRRQLDRAIDSGRFLVGPHQENYDLLVTAATDPYTQCGFRKMICISHISDFVLPHLPDRYVGKLGLESNEFLRQIEALQAIHYKTRPCTSLLNGGTRVAQSRWAKSYYEPVNRDLLALVPRVARTVLSFGCGCGAMEAELTRRGVHVTAVPLDSVIGVCAESRGFEVVYGNLDSSLASLGGRRFDCVLLSNMLHLARQPESLLSHLAELLSSKGVVVAAVPNLSQLPILWKRARRDPALATLASYESSGIRLTSVRIVRTWFKKAGLKVQEMRPTIPRRARWAYRATGSLTSGWLASEFLLLATR